MTSQCLYQGTAGHIAGLIATNQLIQELTERFRDLFGGEPSDSEVRSWRNSIPNVISLLVEANLADVQVLIEFKAPITDVRMDLLLVGSYPQSGQMSIVVVENKQWSRIYRDEYSDMVNVTGAPGSNPRLHPITQAWGYRQVLLDYISLVAQSAQVHSIVNMHEASTETLYAVRPSLLNISCDQSYIRWYGAEHRTAFKRDLHRVLTPERADIYAHELLAAPVSPTGGLMAVVSESVCRRSVFTLLDEQREAYDYVRRAVAASKQGAPKEVVLIVGGPGTGKSVIAVELLGALNRQGVRAVHATGSRSFTQTLRDNVERMDRRARHSFSYFNSYTHATPNDIDVLICDEAHRIRHTSRKRSSYDETQARPADRPQVTELINAAHVPVFLLDEHQVVRRGEVGSIELIKKAAQYMKLKVHQIDLRHQFRCGGCPEYVAWIEQLLGLGTDEGPQRWNPLDTFELYVARTPDAMEKYLRRKIAAGKSARIAAGYCWPWSKPRSDGTLVNDIKIGSWSRPWNSSAERKVNGIPPSSLWATDPAGFDQIGCIYTAQGFEYEYSGVIFGRDLTWTSQGWIVDDQANQDPAVNRAPHFEKLVRNTYRVLATRGMRGAVLFSEDLNTNRLFAKLGVPLLPDE